MAVPLGQMGDLHGRGLERNLCCTAKDPLTEEEMQIMNGLDRNCRLIKGQVFLWEGAESWEDLWDLNGTITQ